MSWFIYFILILGVIILNITYFIPPGVFPTAVKDPGDWIDDVSNVEIFNCNYFFWKVVFGSELFEIINKSYSSVEMKDNEGFKQSTEKSIEALNKLTNLMTYDSSEEYIKCITYLTTQLKMINNFQKECSFTFMPGVKVNNLNYNKSGELLDYSNRATLLSNIIEKALESIKNKIDVLLVEITSQQDLLTSMISVNLLRKVNPDMYVSLVNHGYENFSLNSFMDNLKKTNNITKVFDSVVENEFEKDLVIKALINEVAFGTFRKGFVKISDFDYKVSLEKQNNIFPLVPTYSGEPILWTRLSANRCYWNKCTFCTHNTKHRQETNLDINYNESLKRINRFIEAGYKNFIFSDEALNMGVIINFCNAIIKNKMEFKWLCRLRIEENYTEDLFKLMKQAGCYEIMFGLESVSKKVLDAMNKYTKIPDKKTITKVLNSVIKSDISVHLNLIAGFPGETSSDVEDTINFVIKTFGGKNGVTFTINKFSLFSNTAIMSNPNKFNITPIVEKGDMHYCYKFKYNLGEYVDEKLLNTLITKSYNKLMKGLGWTKFGFSEGVNVALFLYFNSCHNGVFKSKRINPFEDKLDICNF